MTLKIFFKPNSLKIIISFIILTIAFFGGLFGGLHCDFYGCGFGLFEKTMITIGFIPHLLSILTKTSMLGFFIFDLLYSYILGCIISNFIIFVYSKVKK